MVTKQKNPQLGDLVFPQPANALPSYAGIRVDSDGRFQKFLQRWSRIQPGERQRCAMADRGAGEIRCRPGDDPVRHPILSACALVTAQVQ